MHLTIARATVKVCAASIQSAMSVTVRLESVRPRKMAAVHREIARADVGRAWRPALDLVWQYVRSQPGLWADGHNVFVYHHAKEPGGTILCEFGVEVTRRFETAGEVYATETPAGEAAVAVYRGPYSGMHEAYKAIEAWMVANGRQAAGHSWEIYGDPAPNPADTVMTVVQLLE